MTDNPCLTCGACCASLRVSFYWSEADPALGGQVPPELTEKLTPHLRCMKGTNAKAPRCIALLGNIGDRISCSIYELRPTPCREFGVTWENGVLIGSLEELERCNRVRGKVGLPLLPASLIQK